MGEYGPGFGDVSGEHGPGFGDYDCGSIHSRHNHTSRYVVNHSPARTLSKTKGKNVSSTTPQRLFKHRLFKKSRNLKAGQTNFVNPKPKGG